VVEVEGIGAHTRDAGVRERLLNHLDLRAAVIGVALGGGRDDLVVVVPVVHVLAPDLLPHARGLIVKVGNTIVKLRLRPLRHARRYHRMHIPSRHAHRRPRRNASLALERGAGAGLRRRPRGAGAPDPGARGRFHCRGCHGCKRVRKAHDQATRARQGRRRWQRVGLGGGQEGRAFVEQLRRTALSWGGRKRGRPPGCLM
jgi:hypothetical protein